MSVEERNNGAIIRDAEDKDIDEIVSLIYKFCEESLGEYNLSFSTETLKSTTKNFIDNLIGLVIEKDGQVVGMIGGVVSPSMFDSNQIVGQETVWYISKDYRGGSIGFRLMKEFEKRCKSMGATLVYMGHMNNLNADILKRFYEKGNYKSMETHYIKRI